MLHECGKLSSGLESSPNARNDDSTELRSNSSCAEFGSRNKRFHRALKGINAVSKKMEASTSGPLHASKLK